jgi:DUF1365 family protein
MTSCVYRGTLRHRRLTPVPHEFRYPLFMLYLDLAELPGVFDGRWCWSARRPALAWFRRADYFGDPDVPIDTAVRDCVERERGQRPAGPIRLLTHLRYFGYIQNPVSFYYCFDPSGERVETIVAEITNTPWGERHAYIIEGDGRGGPHRVKLAKTFHVSPFMPMDQQYDWRLPTPDEHLRVHMVNEIDGRRVFDATLVMRRAPLTGPVLASCLVRHPVMTARVAAGIYWQALRLWWKGVPFHAHPRTRSREQGESRRSNGVVHTGR